jgi:integrase
MNNIVVLEVIPQFFCYSPLPYGLKEPIRQFSSTSTKQVLDLEKYLEGESVFHFPVILVDGIAWRHSTDFLLGRARDIDPVNPKTLLGIARDLRDFKAWTISYDIDYLKCNKLPQSPLRRYKRYLITTSYSQNVIRRKLSRVVSFYRWLQVDQKIVFEKPLWNDLESKILTTTRHGSRVLLNVKSTDVQKVRGRGQLRGVGYDGYIQDGGLLRPHNVSEQRIILSCLREIDNTEMTLGFLVALTTGARLQTIFTLRKCHFDREVKEGLAEIIIYVGPWPRVSTNNDLAGPMSYAGLTDTKNSKPLKLYFPVWVYQKIKVYLNSERYQMRASRSEHCVIDRNCQYVFLTTRARPFYMSSKDPLSLTYREPPAGGAVQQFISQQLRPKLIKNGFSGHFKFHNLRATFGMNLVRSNEECVGSVNGISLTELFSLVQTRLGHSSQLTTQGYLSFDLKQEVAASAQGNYEKFLNDLYKNMKGDWQNA